MLGFDWQQRIWKNYDIQNADWTNSHFKRTNLHHGPSSKKAVERYLPKHRLLSPV